MNKYTVTYIDCDATLVVHTVKANNHSEVYEKIFKLENGNHFTIKSIEIN